MIRPMILLSPHIYRSAGAALQDRPGGHLDMAARLLPLSQALRLLLSGRICAQTLFAMSVGVCSRAVAIVRWHSWGGHSSNVAWALLR
jgi:hypothetical protein